MHYVIALEGLLAGDEPDHSELTRKVSQRAAVFLAGKDGTQRLEIAKLVRDAYAARSRYAHGSESERRSTFPSCARSSVVASCPG